MKHKSRFIKFFEEYGALFIPLVISLIVICICILFSSYETSYTLYVDNNSYECDDFILRDDYIEIHTSCISSSFISFSPHSKYCSFYKIPICESYSVVEHRKTHWNDLFGD